MCTSYALFADKTYIGMNFDISNRPISLHLKGGQQFIVQQKDGTNTYPAFGINRQGVFMNLLTVEPNDAGKYRRGKDCVHIPRMFEELLSNSISISSLPALLKEKTLVNGPDLSVHSLVTGPNRLACVLEPGYSRMPIQISDGNFLALTNFPLANLIKKGAVEPVGDGAERYNTCCQMLKGHDFIFSLDQGLAILAATAQKAGDYPTQFSMLATPEDEHIVFCLKHNFNKRFSFSFADGVLRTEMGFAHPHSRMLDSRGIFLTELENW